MNRTAHTPAAVRAHDLMHACIHEYAHQHVARHFGILGFVNIENNDDGGLYESHWVGQFCMFTPPPHPHAAAMMGLAGNVAEHVLEHRFITPEDLFQEFDLDPDSLSETDAKYVGEVTPSKVASALWLVRKYWGDIVADADLQAGVEDRAALEAA